MLSSIRNKTKGVFAYFIVGLITVPFALFGISEYFTGTANVMVAEVDGTEISRDSFLAIFNQNKRRAQEQLGDKYTNEYEQKLKTSVINSMIDRRVLEDFANKLNQSATLDELRASIRADNNFKEEGVFSKEKYQRLLRVNGYHYLEYEKEKLGELAREQVKYNLLDSAFVTQSSSKKIQQLNAQERDFDYISLNTDDYLDVESIDQAAIQKFYDQKKDSFFEAQKLKVDFIELSLTDIQKNIEVNDEDLLNFYEEEKDRFTTEEERQAQHILLDSEKKAKEVADLLAQGGDFAQLAQTHSQDDGSKDQGGDLGFFTIGVMTPEFEEKAFSMKVGELSAPIKTEFGYHIIKLVAIHPVNVKAFDEDLRGELLELYTKNQAQKLLYDLTEQLSNLAYETTLEAVAEQMGLDLKTSDFFAKNSDKYDKKFINAAFSAVVLNKGENSDLIELSKNKFAILRLKDRVAQRQKTFKEVEKDIRLDLSTKSAQKIANNIAKKIVTELSAANHKAAKALIKKHQLKWQKIGWVKRNSDKASVAIINQVFSLSKPVDNQVIYKAQNINLGQSVVIKLSKVKTSDYQPNNLFDKTLLSLESNEIMNAILATLKSKAEIEIFTRNL